MPLDRQKRNHEPGRKTFNLLKGFQSFKPLLAPPPRRDCVATVISRRSREILFLHLAENARFLAGARNGNNDKVGAFRIATQSRREGGPEIGLNGEL